MGQKRGFHRNDENSNKPVEHVINTLALLWGNGVQWETDNCQHPHEAGYLKLDCSKARNRLGWTPCWDLTTALEKVVDWYKVYQYDRQKIREKTTKQITDYMKDRKS